MSIVKNSTVAKMAAGLVGVAMALSMVWAVPANAATVEELTAQINSLLATISSLQVQLASMTGGSTAPAAGSCGFTRSLTMESEGADVTCLQDYLTGTGHFTFSGGSTGYFGSITRTAVAAWQAANGVAPAVGYFGPISQAKYNSLVAVSVPTTPTTPTTPSVGTGLSVGTTVQASNTLAPDSAARVPFTSFTITAGSDGDVTVNGVVVERVGLSADAVFAGIVLLDENDQQLSTAKTLNSDHQATVGGTFTVPAGMTKTYTVAGNMAADNSTRDGQVVGLNVVQVKTDATVSGSLPITGSSHTVNSSLTIGTVTPSRGVDDPNAAASKEVGTTNFLFSSVKITAGSAEKVRLHSFRWNQSGSASKDDLANVMVYVDGVAYTPTVSSDGKYYTATFGTGLVIDKGLSKEVSIRGDIVSGSARTIAFDVDKITDIYVTGETFNYGISPATSGTGFTSASPVYNTNGIVTVANGSITVSKATSVAAQNIGVNVPNQVLGGIDVEVDGEAISVASMVFTVATSSTGNGLLTNVTMVDQNGSVVAGPVDTSGAGTSITFTDTVTFPVGKGTYTIKGQTPTGLTNNGTYTLSLTPSSAFTTVTGQETGNTITPAPASAVTLNAMTVKTGTVTISTSASPAAQTVVAGGQGITFANYQFDATASGEDVRFTTLTPLLAHTGGVPEYLTGCSMWDGSTALNTGSNKVDVSSTWTTGDVTFTLDSGGVTIPKGTIKTLTLKCDLSSSATSSAYTWGMTTSQTGTGLDSGTTVTATASGAGQAITPSANGTFTASLDASSPSYAVASAGSSDVILNVIKFVSSNEAMNVKKVSLQLTNTASSSASDLTSVTLWDGGTQVGSAIFTGSNTNATATLTGNFIIPKDAYKNMTVKGNLASIGTGQVGTQGALIAVDYDNDDLAGTQAVGASSGSTQNVSTTADTASAGVRMYKSFPTLAKVGTGIASSLINGDQPLLRFSVTADSRGDVGLDGFSFRMATTGVTVASINAYAYTDSNFSSAASGVGASGKLSNSNLTWVSGTADIAVDIDAAGTDTVLQVPAGGTRYIEIRGDVSSAGTAGDSVSTTLQGDAAHASLATGVMMGTAATVTADTNNDFVWSPNATTSSANAHVDFTNGYGLIGLPSNGMNAQTISY